MKKAEDFRKAFGPATPGFESAAKETIRELRAKESQKKRRMAGEWLRYRKPVLAMAMALVLFIGFVALNGTLNLSGHMDQTRLGKDQYTAQPITTVLSMGAGQEEGDGAADGLPAATLSEEEILVELGEKDPELCAKMCPVNLSYEENGIRWEVLFGMLDEHELAFVYSMQNLDEEKYAGYGQSRSFDAELPDVYSDGASGYVLCEDEAANRTVYVFERNYPYDTGYVNADAEIHMHNSLRLEETVDLLPLLQQYGKTEEGVDHPEYIIGRTYEYEGRKPAPEYMKVLDYTQPLDVPLFKDVCLAGIGWINNRLHIQFHNRASGGLDKGDIIWGTWWEYIEASYKTAYSPVEWDEDGDQNPEWREYVLNISPDEAKELEYLKVTIAVLEDVIEGPKDIHVPLETIRGGYNRAPKMNFSEKERIENRVNLFMSRWSEKNYDGMVLLCDPEWRENTADPRQELMTIIRNAELLDYQYKGISGIIGGYTANYTADLGRAGGILRTSLELKIGVKKTEHGLWYIKPESLRTCIAAAAFHAEETDNTETDDEDLSSLPEEEAIRIRIDEEVPGLSEKLIPINQVCEKQGLRVEVVSGYVCGKESNFLISVQDPEGKYAGSEVFPYFINDISGYASWCTVYQNEAEHKTVWLISLNPGSLIPFSDRNIRVGVDWFRIEKHEYIDLVPLLKQYGKTTEGVGQPSQLVVSNKYPPRDMKYLDYTRPLDVPLFGNVCLSGIGWIDGQLHVQYHYTGEENGVDQDNAWGAYGCGYGSVDKPEYSGVMWDANYDGHAEWKEEIYNGKPEEIEDLGLVADVMVLEEVLKDGWTVEIPLESVYVDEAGYYSGMDDQLNIFMTGWSSHAYDYTLKVCDPEWKEAHEDPQAALKELTRNATMLEKRVERVDGAKDDPVRTVVCTVSVRLPGEKAYTSFRLDIEMRKAEDGLWYINPDSLETWTAVNENADEPAEAAEAETK